MILDSIISFDNIFVSIHNMDNKSREALLITIGTNKRSWYSTPFILDSNFHIGKFGVFKFSPKKLVVQIERVSESLQ